MIYSICFKTIQKQANEQKLKKRRGAVEGDGQMEEVWQSQGSA